jgi:hypothetical protein
MMMPPNPAAFIVKRRPHKKTIIPVKWYEH